uniref:Uncharacterized protein n=1 Tax=Arundo donax TaxID=35708 RepID=A0A0A9F6E8_ARUDO
MIECKGNKTGAETSYKFCCLPYFP